MNEHENPGADLIKTERERQIDLEGWTPEHDDAHNIGEMSQAAICYIQHAVNNSYIGIGNINKYKAAPAPKDWPWSKNWWKPKHPRRDLVRAGALIAAEHDRILRADVDRISAGGE